MIPKILHFIWIGDESARPDNFVGSWVRHNPGWTIKLWTNDDLASRPWRNRRQIAAVGQVDARLAAELMRWEILLDEGGLAFDIDSACVHPLEGFLLECEMFASWENELTEPGLVCSKFVGAHPANPLIQRLVDSIQAEAHPVAAPSPRNGDSRRLTRIWRELRYPGLTVFPSHYFNPRSRDGFAYRGSGRVFAVHQWASSGGRARTLHRSDVESSWSAEQSGLAAPARAAPPRFSIVIPTYNRADTLGQAIQSALAQNHDDFEVLVVDDGSTDSTAEFLASQHDPRVRAVRQANGGEAAARNRGLSEARGDYVVWLDSDDLLLPGALALYSRRIDAGAATDVMYGHLILIDKEGRETSQVRYEDLSVVPLFPTLFLKNRLPNPGTAVRRGLFNSIGLYDTRLESSPDYDFWVRAAAGRASFSCVNEFVCRYRWYGGNISSDTSKIRRADAQIARKCLESIPLPTLFPNLDWKSPQLAVTQACLLSALVFAERGDLRACAETAAHAREAALASCQTPGSPASPRIAAATQAQEAATSLVEP